MIRCLTYVFVLVLSLFSAAVAAETILLPVPLRVTPGAFGTSWEVEAWVLNASQEPVRVVLMPCELGGGIACDQEIAPGSVGHLPTDTGPVLPVQSLVVPDVHAREIHVSVRAVESTFHPLDAGTELPVARAHDLCFRTLHLLNVPVASGFRSLLRVIAVPSEDDAPIHARVRVFSMATGERLAEQHVVLSSSLSLPPTWLGKSVPRAEVLFAGGIVSEAIEGRVRVEVEPVTESALWAFVTVTNNDTQHLTTVTPDRSRGCVGD